MSVRPFRLVARPSGDCVEIGWATECEGAFEARITVEQAEKFCAQVAEAINEARRQADPFEKWWSCQEVDFPGAVWAAMGGCRFNKAAARKIWDSMVSVMAEKKQP